MAEQEKLVGNQEYKKKNFEAALEHYNKARELDPTEMIYSLNAAAALLELNNYELSVDMCLEAIKVGEANRAPFKSIAKAYVRAGNASYKKGDLKQAKIYYDKSLIEERNSEIVSKVYQIDREIRKQEEVEYRNPEIAKEEKEKGNGYFKEGDYPRAVEHYNEAIKRAPEDSRIYSNRAACFSMLLEYPSALKDCEKAISLDPTFIKPYLRQGAIYLSMKEVYKAKKAYESALQLDPKCSEAIEGLRKCSSDPSSNMDQIREEALKDPEIQQIISDPGMRVILEQAQNDPSSLMEHLKDPTIAAKFEKLVKSGIVGVK